MRRAILVSAYACEPDKGSEQGVGWRWVLELAKTNELWVITRSNNRESIEKALPDELAGRLHFIYYDLPSLVRKFKRKERGLYLYYLIWQWGAYRRAKQLCATQGFDYCLHLTFGSIWLPTFMHRLPIPFIWGPVGGGEAVPFDLIETLPWRGRFVQYTRYVLIRLLRFNPLFNGPSKCARAILVRTEDTAAVFSKRDRDKISVILETAMSGEFLSSTAEIAGDSGSEIRFVYSGRLVPLKNVAMAIESFARARDRCDRIRLTIIGDGPLRQSLKNLAVDCGVADDIEFAGRLGQYAVIERLRQSQGFIFPSLKEGGSWSLMEAMAVGLPVICVETSGMRVITDATSALRVRPTSATQMVEGFADGIVALARSAQLRRQMGRAARQRIEEHFSWSQKGNFLRKLFDDLERRSAMDGDK